MWVGFGLVSFGVFVLVDNMEIRRLLELLKV
jgi:hypothetical protein